MSVPTLDDSHFYSVLVISAHRINYKHYNLYQALFVSRGPEYEASTDLPPSTLPSMKF